MTAFVFPPFENHNGHLVLENLDLVDLIDKMGSPLLVVSENKIRENYRKLDSAFRKRYSKFSVRYAVKSYPNLAVISILRQEGAGTDCSTPEEIKISNMAGIAHKDIAFTPNNAHKTELQYGIEKGVAINFDDIPQMRLVKDSLPEVVSFRVNPGVGGGEFPGIVTAGPKAKFGIPVNLVVDAFREAKGYGAKKFGMQMMAGSNVLDWKHFDAVTKAYFDLAGKVSGELGIQFQYLDIGGGFGVPYREGQVELDLEKAASCIVDNLRNACSKYGMEEPILMVEPGRSMVSNSAVLLGKVTNVKSYDKTFVGTDIGMNLLLRPALYGAFHHIVIANDLDREIRGEVDVVGQICESTDKIGKDILFPRAEVGDTVAVFNAGAYVSSMSSNYNGHLKPAEVLVGKKGVSVIRNAETPSDLVKGMVVPEHLKV